MLAHSLYLAPVVLGAPLLLQLVGTDFAGCARTADYGTVVLATAIHNGISNVTNPFVPFVTSENTWFAKFHHHV